MFRGTSSFGNPTACKCCQMEEDKRTCERYRLVQHQHDDVSNAHAHATAASGALSTSSLEERKMRSKGIVARAPAAVAPETLCKTIDAALHSAEPEAEGCAIQSVTSAHRPSSRFAAAGLQAVIGYFD